jgi:hypothetical protein
VIPTGRRRDPSLPWLAQVLRHAPQLVRTHLPGAPLPPRARERLLVTVAEENGVASIAWVHGGWERYHGSVAAADADEAVLDWARRSARAGEPQDPTPLRTVLPPAAVDAVRVTVARAELASQVGASAEALLNRARRRQPVLPRLGRDLTRVGIGGPLALSVGAVGLALGAIDRVVPGVPEVEIVDDEPNLLAHLIAESLPAWLTGVRPRLAVLGVPVDIVIAVRSGRSAATVRFGKGRISVANGVQPDAWVLLDGDGEPLMRVAVSALAHELTQAGAWPR